MMHRSSLLTRRLTSTLPTALQRPNLAQNPGIRSFATQASVKTGGQPQSIFPLVAGGVGILGAGGYILSRWTTKNQAALDIIKEKKEAESDVAEADSVELINWSGTHSVTSTRYYTPENLEQLKDLVAGCHERGEPIRPVGSALSPNGLGLNEGGMVNLALMDQVLEVDKERLQVRVQAGCRVEALVEALRPHGLTLANYASIVEQQVGAFAQVGAHGTGVGIPTVDEQVIALQLVTPAVGVLDLKVTDNAEDDMLFRLARTALGLLGVVSELTLQCVPAHRLIERTRVYTRSEVAANHEKWIHAHRHLRYMWIPHTDAVVVVTCDPFDGSDSDAEKLVLDSRPASTTDPATPARELLLSHPKCQVDKATVESLAFTELRSELLRLDSVDASWVAKVNGVEAVFWRGCEGVRVDWSDRILQFDCGGQQWVSEVAFPVPKGSLADVKYVESVLSTIEKEGIAAPAPIEQRWSAPSTSPMSAACEKPEQELAPYYSWVGIIMYLPEGPGTETARNEVTSAFRKYKAACESLWVEIGAVEHWAKIEMPATGKERFALQSRTARKYPLDAFNAVRALLDPKGILSNPLMDTVLSASVVRGDIMCARRLG